MMFERPSFMPGMGVSDGRVASTINIIRAILVKRDIVVRRLVFKKIPPFYCDNASNICESLAVLSSFIVILCGKHTIGVIEFEIQP